MAFVAVAAAGVGAIGSIVAGSKAAGAQRDAAAQNAALQQAQIAENRRQYDQNRADLAPYRSVGNGALYQLSDLMGINPVAGTSTAAPMSSGGGQDWNAYLATNPDLQTAWSSNADNYQGRFGTPEAFAQWHYQTHGQNEGRTVPTLAGSTGSAPAGYNSGVQSSEFGSLSKRFSLADFNADPGYQFRKDEGAKAVDASAAARGGVLSGAAMKAMARYGQDFASNEYNNAYNRYNQDQTTRFNRLSALAGTGQTATNQGIAAGNTLQEQNQTGINNIASNNNAAANATASQYAGIGNTISNTANNISGYFAMKDLYSGGMASPGASAALTKAAYVDPSSLLPKSTPPIYGGI